MKHITKRIAALLCAAAMLGALAACEQDADAQASGTLEDGRIIVNAPKEEVTVALNGADIAVTCGGDAIRSTNDTDGTLGWVSVSNSTLNLSAGEDVIQAETALTMSDGSYQSNQQYPA